MSLQPAQQEAPKKPKRTSRSKVSAKRQAAAKEQLTPDTSEEEDSLESPSDEPSPAVPTVPPVFVQRDLKGPDGSIRSGWEMWIGDHCFGRADSKELLLASFERLQSPPSSFHWREVRNRMPMRNRPKTQVEEPVEAEEPTASVAPEQDNSWSWDDQEEETLLTDEEGEGIQGLSWETPAQ